MQKDNFWKNDSLKTITKTKHLLSDFSIKVRTAQFLVFRKTFKPNSKTRVLDVGVTSDETLKDSNLFERLYKWPQKITAATIENAKVLRSLYPKIGVVKVTPLRKLPFRNQSFDVVVSWATLEHTGNYKQQEFFLNELLRIGNKVFITTPYRGALYEPHTGVFFLHWLPLPLFRKVCVFLGKKSWSTEANLNPLWVSDLTNMKLLRKVNFRIYKTFNLLPSHIIITG